MNVRVTFTVGVSEDFRRALRAYYGGTGLATREEVKQWYIDNARSYDDDLEYEHKQREEGR